MRHLWLAAHFLGFALWMGGGFSAMTVGIAMGSAPRTQLQVMIGIQSRLHRALILPGSLLTAISGLMLTLQLYGTATSVAGFPVPLMVMQGAGLLAAILVLVVSFPAVSRLSRLDPVGEYAPLFDALVKRARLTGSLTAVLALTALIAGALLR